MLAFPSAPVAEKAWTRAGPEFGAQGKQGAIIRIKRASHGLKTASKAYHDFFGELLLRLGFKPTRADQDPWHRKADDHDGCDHIATHVDDIAIAAKRPAKYMDQIEQEFLARDKEDSPSCYLGNDMKVCNEKHLHVSSGTHIKEMLRRYQDKCQPVAEQNVPMSPNAHPELDTSELLGEEDVKEHQHIIGTGQWLVISGRFDTCHAMSSLSRCSAAPRRGHLELARKVFGYLRKYPRKGHVINPTPPVVDKKHENVELNHDFGYQCHCFQEDLDPQFPDPLVPESDINIFVDANHAHDKVTGRSITGLISFIGSTPTTYKSKSQTTVQTSTFGAEFTALKRAVEEAVTLRYYLRAMGIKVSKPAAIYCDNLGVALNASDPGSTLNKKWVALACHFVREHAANDVVSIRKIDSADNFADPFTKSLNSKEFHDFFYECMTN